MGMSATSGLLRMVILMLIALGAADVQAQTERTIDGRTYTVHIVEQGQTLFAIGRAHAVPVDALLKANPSATEGLSIGQEILVPRDAVVKKEARSAPILLRDGELQHVVARKETLFGIARRYELDVNVLLHRNPDLNSGLREGMVVIIPLGMGATQPAAATRPAAPEGMRSHLVKPGETIYRLAQQYGVTVEAITEANDGLPHGLKAGTLIHVPGLSGEPIDPMQPGTPVVQRRFKVGLMLPFARERNDSALAHVPPGSVPRFHEASRIAAQFYAGALLAIDSARAQGLHAEIHVIDVGDEAREWTPVIRRAGATPMDLYIGPFHRQAVEELARMAPTAHVVCPVPQSNKVILGHGNVSKVIPTRTDLVRHAARHIALRHDHDHVILLRPDIAGEKEIQDLAARTLHDAIAARPGTFGDSLYIAKPGRRDLGDIPGKLRTGRLNVLFAPSDDLEYVSSLVTKLRTLTDKHQIMLVGLESWSTMSTLSAADLDKLGFTFASATFVDHADPRIIAFTKAFQERSGHDVDEYALLGYDVTRYYLNALRTEGAELAHAFDTLRGEGTHMAFRLTRTGPENGYRNEGAVMVRQRDLRLERIP